MVTAAWASDAGIQREDPAAVAVGPQYTTTHVYVATADLDYINSIFAHNLAKLTFARAIGHAEENLQQFLRY